MAERGRPLPFALREQRLAIASRALGIPLSYFGDFSRSERMLVCDALQSTGLYASHEQEFFTARKTVEKSFGVYLFGAVDQRLVKVGFTGDIESRLRNIRQQVPFAVVLISWIAGADWDTEQAIHSALRQWKKRGEWFYLSQASLTILDLYFPAIDLAAIRKTGFVTKRRASRVKPDERGLFQ